MHRHRPGLLRHRSLLRHLRRELRAHAHGRVRRRAGRPLHRHLRVLQSRVDLWAPPFVRRPRVHAGLQTGLLLADYLGLLRTHHFDCDLRLLARGLQAPQVRGVRLPGLGRRAGLDAGAGLHDPDPLLGRDTGLPSARRHVQGESSTGHCAQRRLGSVGSVSNGGVQGQPEGQQSHHHHPQLGRAPQREQCDDAHAADGHDSAAGRGLGAQQFNASGRADSHRRRRAASSAC
ncbi:hypothetical protein FOCC_FOCC011228 [Frankliniella occidentalis]|nr:hypothetical protein FOCC_FOCC011228 [Frankliniella occidentalis]